VAVATLALTVPARAFHTVFDFTIDRVTVDGNAFGPLDGTPDFVDDFGGTYTTNWVTPYGTSRVENGRLHVRSPAVHYPGPDGTALDLTEVASACWASTFDATEITRKARPRSTPRRPERRSLLPEEQHRGRHHGERRRDRDVEHDRERRHRVHPRLRADRDGRVATARPPSAVDTASAAAHAASGRATRASASP
jgi:hypothetical protein